MGVGMVWRRRISRKIKVKMPQSMDFYLLSGRQRDGEMGRRVYVGEVFRLAGESSS
jgi:hypothetical protein